MIQSLHLTLSEYDTMVNLGAFDHVDRKVELMRGELVEMNPTGPVQTGIDLPEQESRPEPDIVWVQKKRYRERHPQAEDVQLAIEVADSSLAKDLEVKRLLYAEARIVEYWVVDCRSNCIHVFREPEGTDYQTRFVVTARDQLSPLVAPNAKLDLRDLFEGS